MISIEMPPVNGLPHPKENERMRERKGAHANQFPKVYMFAAFDISMKIKLYCLSVVLVVSDKITLSLFGWSHHMFLNVTVQFVTPYEMCTTPTHADTRTHTPKCISRDWHISLTCKNVNQFNFTWMNFNSILKDFNWIHLSILLHLHSFASWN